MNKIILPIICAYQDTYNLLLLFSCFSLQYKLPRIYVTLSTCSIYRKKKKIIATSILLHIPFKHTCIQDQLYFCSCVVYLQHIHITCIQVTRFLLYQMCNIYKLVVFKTRQIKSYKDRLGCVILALKQSNCYFIIPSRLIPIYIWIKMYLNNFKFSVVLSLHNNNITLLCLAV